MLFTVVGATLFAVDELNIEQLLIEKYSSTLSNQQALSNLDDNVV